VDVCPSPKLQDEVRAEFPVELFVKLTTSGGVQVSIVEGENDALGNKSTTSMSCGMVTDPKHPLISDTERIGVNRPVLE